MDDLPIGSRGVQQVQVLGHRPAGDCDLVAVQQSLVEQHPHQHRHPTDPVDVDHVVVAVGLGVGQVRHPGGHLVEILQLQFHSGLEGDGQQV